MNDSERGDAAVTDPSRVSPTGPDVLAGDAGADGRPTSAIAKGFSLLEALLAEGGSASLHALAERAGLPKPSAHRMLAQLEEIGAVKRELDGKGYAVGDALMALSLGAAGVAVRLGGARDVMAGLVETVGETCNLGVLDGRSVLYLERVECAHALRLHLRAGSRVPLHATAVGKLILAYAPAEKRDLLLAGPLPKLTARTLDRAALEAELPGIRRTGLSVNREEATPGVGGVAAPVFGPGGAFVAGLSIHAPLARGAAAARAGGAGARRAAADRIGRTLEAEKL